MKRIFLLGFFVLMFLLFPFSCYAADLQAAQDANTIVSAVKEFSYHVEAGIRYPRYVDLYNDLYVMKRRYEDKYPQSPLLPQLNTTMQLYEDIRTVWSSKGYVENYVPENLVKYLKNKYPGIEKEVERDWLGQWNNKMSVVNALFRKSPASISQLNQIYKDTYVTQPQVKDTDSFSPGFSPEK